MSVLEKIVAQKKKEVAERQKQYPYAKLEKSFHWNRPPIRLTTAITAKNSSGIIAEFKRRSPSKGIINDQVQIDQVSTGYVRAGAAALSILTDTPFFGGHVEDLTRAREINMVPILRKDFIISDYQIMEARSLGADVILLIAAVLPPEEVRRLSAFAGSLGMEVLLELHDADETGHICDSVQLVGVNNRNLSDFTVDVGRSFDLAGQLPKDKVWVAESGLQDPAVVRELKSAGFHGFLIGEYFMREARPEEACRRFVSGLQADEKTGREHPA